MTKIVNYSASDDIAVITLDDGGNNLISPTMIQQLNSALDQAEAEGKVVILTGAREVFSAGFDLKILRSGVLNAFGMLTGGFALSRRLLAFPRPIILACNGHAIAMGSFLLLSVDYRIGTNGDYKIVANEVQNGLTLPYSALVVCKYRLKPGFYDRVGNLSEVFDPATAIDAGFFDEVCDADQLLAVATTHAKQFAGLNNNAFRRTKLRMRRDVLKQMARAIRADRLDFIRMGVSRLFKR